MGGKFKVDQEQSKEFSQKMEAALYENMENGHTNPFKLSKISNEASQHCKKVITELKAGPKLNQEQEHEQHQEQNRGRSR